MKQRLFCLWLLLSAAVGLSAYDFEYGDLYYNITSNSTVEIIEGDYSELSSVSIPTSVGGYSVTSIGKHAFYGCSGLTSITIPNGVTSIGNYAFYGCSGLTSITIPNSVTSIGRGAFSSCSGLTSITIPNSVTSIGNYAFLGCSGLTSIIVENGNQKYDSRNDCNAIIETATNTLIAGCKNTTISNSVMSIGEAAFFGCSGLTSITIPNSVMSIGEAAFFGCSGLTSITIPNSVTSIGDEAFSGCSGLTSITIPNGVTSIGDKAFYGCRGLTSITIPNSVTSIGEYAFYGCSGLTSITIPNSVTSIGEYAFYGCSGLTSITIPNSVTSIGRGAFSSCSGLTSITIPNSVTSIGGGAFSSCSGLTSITIPNSVTSIGSGAFLGCSGLTSITIPNSVTSIGGGAFSGCSGLTSITINSVTSIGDNAFEGCSGLTSVIWNAKNYPDCNKDNTPFYSEYMDLRSQITSFVFGDSVQHIPSYLCYGMDSITSIIIPNSVTSIGDSAFGESYKKVSKFVCGNPNLKLPNGCFEWFTQDVLDTIVMPASGFDVSEESWATLPKYLKYAQLTGGEMTDNAFSVLNRSYKTLQTLDIQAVSNTSIADEAFKSCYNLRTLRLPSLLTKIPYMAVADCKSLQEITIPATVEEIDNSAFEDCRSIQTITFEGADTPQGTAQYAAAAGCALHRIGNWAFYNCHELQHLTIPKGVTEIGDAAFYGCTYLQDLTLPASVEQIGDNCFALCSKLQKITVLSTTPPAIAAKTFYDVNRTIPVYVPAESVADYKGDIYWKEFNIQANATPIDHTRTNETTLATPRKVVRDGQVLIIRGGKTYTATGVEVK